jgi:hypothetical protein
MFWKRKQKKVQRIHPELVNIIRWQYQYYRLNKNIDLLYIKYK